MGGSINFVIRRPDGREHRLATWTGTMTYYATHIGTIQKDPGHIDALLSQENAEEGPYLHPEGYGLVVIDQVNDVILSCQDYSRIGSFDGSGVISAFCFADPSFESAYSDTLTRLLGLFHAGVPLRCEAATRSATGEFSREDRGEVSEAAARARYTASAPRMVMLDRLCVDMSPYTVERFPVSDLAASKALRRRVRELGFKISRAEMAAWREWESNLE